MRANATDLLPVRASCAKSGGGTGLGALSTHPARCRLLAAADLSVCLLCRNHIPVTKLQPPSAEYFPHPRRSRRCCASRVLPVPTKLDDVHPKWRVACLEVCSAGVGPVHGTQIRETCPRHNATQHWQNVFRRLALLLAEAADEAPHRQGKPCQMFQLPPAQADLCAMKAKVDAMRCVRVCACLSSRLGLQELVWRHPSRRWQASASTF